MEKPVLTSFILIFCSIFIYQFSFSFLVVGSRYSLQYVLCTASVQLSLKGSVFDGVVFSYSMGKRYSHQLLFFHSSDPQGYKLSTNLPLLVPHHISLLPFISYHMDLSTQANEQLATNCVDEQVCLLFSHIVF